MNMNNQSLTAVCLLCALVVGLLVEGPSGVAAFIAYILLACALAARG